MTLRELLFYSRTQLRDLGVKIINETELKRSANEGCRELARILRKARKEYFTTSFTGTIPIATPPDASLLTLPSNFAELKNIQITDADFTNIEFSPLDRSDEHYRRALRDGRSV